MKTSTKNEKPERMKNWIDLLPDFIKYPGTGHKVIDFVYQGFNILYTLSTEGTIKLLRRRFTKNSSRLKNYK